MADINCGATTATNTQKQKSIPLGRFKKKPKSRKSIIVQNSIKLCHSILERTKERKCRAQTRLNKLIAPKTALLAINAITGSTPSSVGISVIPKKDGQIYLAQATIGELNFKGQGPSKKEAKVDMCQHALRKIVLTKLEEQKIALPGNVNQTNFHTVKGVLVSLVSYAIHKLRVDWKFAGFCMTCGGSLSMIIHDPCTCSGQKPEIN